MAKTKRELMNASAMDNALANMAQKIIKRHKKLSNCALVGIRTRGVFLARRLQEKIEKISDKKLLMGVLDITLYRDDLTLISPNPIVKSTEISFPIDGKAIILVDDVLFTGRTIRAALDALIDYGRPEKIELAVLIDRGNRELPISADYEGLKIKTKLTENIHVFCKELEGVDRVSVEPRK